MEEIKRYDHWYNAKVGGVHFEEDESGVFVLHADHERLIAEKNAEIERLKRESDAIEQIHRGHVEGTLCDKIEQQLSSAQERVKGLEDTLKGVRTNVAYAHQPDNCGDHCRNSCRDCVLRYTLEDIDAALSASGGK